MPDEQTNLVLEHLRRIDRKVDRMADDLLEVKSRTIAIEGHLASFHVQVASHSSDIERINKRLDRIERRLELTEP